MNILFLTSRFPSDPNHFTLEKELVYAFNKDGHNCIVANILERKNKLDSYISSIQSQDNINNLKSDIKILNIKTGNLFNNVNFIEKKLTALSLPFIFPRQIKKLLPNHFSENKIDLIIAYGPYLCGHDIIRPLKKYYKCKSILVQWDIFPQNAYDLGIIKNKLIIKYLKNKQRLTLKEHDLILCNSQGNIKYFEQHFPLETEDKLHLFHNCESAKRASKNTLELNRLSSDQLRKSLRQQYSIPLEATTLIFGGNIGIPQALENIVNLAKKLNNNKIYFIIIGQGTEAKNIKNLCKDKSYIKFIDYIPSQEYEKLLQACDYGIISLSNKFTVPNFPAKVTSYLKLGIPIFACLDNSSYNDLGKFILDNNIGLSIQNCNLYDSQNQIEYISNFLLDHNIKNNLKENTSIIFDKFFNIDHTFNSLKNKIQQLF